jgi:quercetin dioxygenase-like cupin family protein
MPSLEPLVPIFEDSELTLESVRLEAGEELALGDGEGDTLLFVHEGSATLVLPGGESALGPSAAGLVLAEEPGMLLAGAGGVAGVRATAGSGADRHAPLGSRETVARLDPARADSATGSRSFQVLLGPHNGSTRATMFVGFVPPGKAPWHYHLYDEIVWIPRGPGRLHVGESIEDLGAGAAFRLRPRQVHIVENTSADAELMLLGVFTPAGSPSAAYLAGESAGEHRVTD